MKSNTYYKINHSDNVYTLIKTNNEQIEDLSHMAAYSVGLDDYFNLTENEEKELNIKNSNYYGHGIYLFGYGIMNKLEEISEFEYDNLYAQKYCKWLIAFSSKSAENTDYIPFKQHSGGQLMGSIKANKILIGK